MNASSSNRQPVISAMSACWRLSRAGFALTFLTIALRADQVVSTGAAANQIKQVSDPSLVRTDGTVVIATQGKALFRSGGQIVLKPGFSAVAGSFFHAMVEPSFSVPLTWAAVANALKYEIYRDGMKIGETTSTAYFDMIASTGGSYSYVIKAVFESGSTADVTTVQTGNPTLEVFTPISQ